MFGLSKRERAQKALSSAIHYLLIGRREDRQDILSEMAGEIEAVSRDALGETQAYAAAIRIVKDYILNKLEHLEVEQRVDILERMAAKRLNAPPEIMRLIAHVAYCIAVLEDDAKSPVQSGATDAFLTTIASWFTEDPKLQGRVLRYLYQSTESHHEYLQELKRQNEERMGLRPKGRTAGSSAR